MEKNPLFELTYNIQLEYARMRLPTARLPPETGL